MSPYLLASSRGHWDKLILVLQSSKEACRYANDLPPVCGSCPVPGVVLLLLLFLSRVVRTNSRIQTDEVPRTRKEYLKRETPAVAWGEKSSERQDHSGRNKHPTTVVVGEVDRERKSGRIV